ncbi:hypothetical protein M405DRAFT_861490 [Rhizopogon salebrosus TDB-379]|nr:hypothetical protein M405DRAFT_861490 [Rhizopogon salebrosus TDB-379]
MSTCEGKPMIIIVERQQRGSLHFHLIEDPDMNAVMYGNDVYTASKALCSYPTKMTELVYALIVDANINVIVAETLSLAELIVQKTQLVASQNAAALKSFL